MRRRWPLLGLLAQSTLLLVLYPTASFGEDAPANEGKHQPEPDVRGETKAESDGADKVETEAEADGTDEGETEAEADGTDEGETEGTDDPEENAGAPERKLGPKELDQFLARVEKRLGFLESLQTDFVQEKHLSMFSDVVVSRGSLAFARSNRLRWEITEPFHSLLVVNGARLGKFDFPDGKPRKLKLGGEDVIREITRQISLWHQGRFRRQAGSYQVDAYVGARKRVVLTPKSRELRESIRAIELEFSDDLSRITSVAIRESGGDHTLMRFVREERDAELPEGLFDVDNPAPGRPRPEAAPPKG